MREEMRQDDDERSGDWWLRSLARGSDMAAMVAELDWSTTPLGPPSGWSSSLRAAVRLCLSTRFPVLITWGPELINIYNDGYRELLGHDKHPEALGSPCATVWPEVWDTLEPMFAGVLAGGGPTWSEHQLLEIRRDGFVEDCWFTFSFGPIIDDDGTVGGVLDIVSETTTEVVTQRRLSCLGDLAGDLVSGMQLADVGTRTVSALARWPEDVRWVDLHLRFGEELVLVASSRRRQPADEDDQRALLKVAASGEAMVIGDEGPGQTRYALPIGDVTGSGVLLVGLSPRLRFDDSYRSFLELCARSVSSALVSANRRAAELGVQRRISDTLQRAMLKPAADLATVGARYVPAVGHLSVGGDWYDVVPLGDDRRALVVGDCVGHGLEAAAAMGQLRTASRAMLLEGHGPAALLEAMDRFAASIDASCTTMVCAIADLRADTLTYAAAGHPPPLLVGPTRTMWLDGGRGAPLDVVAERRSEAVVDILPGDSLILYSDGLVERRGEDIDVGLERLLAAASARRHLPVQRLADGLLDELLGDDVADDVVLVVKRVEHRPADATGGRRA